MVKSLKVRLLLVISIVIVLSVGMLYSLRIYHVSQENLKNQEVESSLLESIKQTRLDLSDNISTLSDYIISLSREDYIESDILDTATEKLNSYKEALSLGTRDVESMGLLSTFKERDMLEVSIKQNSDTYNKLLSSLNSTESLSYSLSEYAENQEIKIASDYLSLLLEEARDSISVLKEHGYQNLQDLQSLIDKSENLDADDISGIKELSSNLESTLRDAKEYINLNNSIIWDTDTNIWYVDYITSYYSNDLGGNLVEWEDGYFVAHDYTIHGQKILSRPIMVVVDGISYKYISEKYVPEGTEWYEVEEFVHSNNGIGFQTCINGQYLILHYEPIK